MPKNHIFLIPTLMFGVFALLTMELGAMGIIPIIAQTYQISVADAGWVVSIFALIVALCGPILPTFFTKYDAKKILIICLSIFATSSFLSAFCTNFILLLILRALPAFFHPIYLAFAFSIAQNSLSPDQAPKAVSKIFMAISAGMTLGVPLTSYVASYTNLAVSFIFFAILHAIALLATIMIIPSQKQTQKSSQKEQFKAFKNPIVWICSLIVIAFFGAMFGFYSYMSEFLLNVSNLSFTFISVLLLVYGFGNVLGNSIAGKVLVKSPEATLKIVPLLFIALYLALFFSGETQIFVTTLLAILGIVAGVGSNMSHFIITQPLPQSKEFANGLYISTANIGTTLGTFLCGLFISFNGSRFGVLASVLLSIFGIVLLLIRTRLLEQKETNGLDNH
ncbi:MFS transporter [Helicobacter cholecystus]|uniref:MFS transporter n=1 Tax=Helicobacter cholecystus TaxID=45498 RepID=A0A3D8IY13_9HELI|nr:MFS transporter [Helicobacter cholecystus]RDU69943.1 MFS transporter [Helicobacter cholecystus]VEJ24891.1 major facilitator family transporter [Helicobacter cholecystus]